MPTIQTVGPEARERLAQKGKTYEELAPYREAIANLKGDAHLELAPEGGETMRQLKLRTNRAAKQVSKDVRYGDTQEGTLLVWLAELTRMKRTRRSRNADGELV